MPNDLLEIGSIWQFKALDCFPPIMSKQNKCTTFSECLLHAPLNKRLLVSRIQSLFANLTQLWESGMSAVISIFNFARTTSDASRCIACGAVAGGLILLTTDDVETFSNVLTSLVVPSLVVKDRQHFGAPRCILSPKRDLTWSLVRD
jgi:hypothetical protein